MNLAARMGNWSARHRKKAVIGWLLLVVCTFVIGSALGTRQITNAEDANGDSRQAEQILARAGFDQPAQENVLVQTRNGRPADAALRAAVGQVVAAVEHTGRVTDVRSPLDAGAAALVSTDGHSMLVQFAMKGDAESAENRVQPVLASVAAVQQANPALRVEEFGDASAAKALDSTLGKDFRRAELLSIPLTLGILLVAFGAVVAALVPLALALTAFMAATGTLALTSRLVHIDGTANSIMLLIGLAVGVDYSLFYLKREREERARGRSPQQALSVAAATSGRSVLVSGLTVAAALGGLFLTGQAEFDGVAEASVLVVLIAILGSLTILPATMAWLGDRIEKGRIPLLRGRRRAVAQPGTVAVGESRAWRGILRVVLRRPAISAVLAAAALAALALPAFGMRTGEQGASDLPKTLPIVATYDRLQAAFPGGPVAAQVVVQAPDVDAAPVQQALSRLSAGAAASGQMSAALSTDVNPARTVAVVAIPLAGSGDDSTSYHALDTLRHTVIPRAFGALTGVQVHVTGETAGGRDFGDQLHARAIWVFAFVLALAFGLLLWAFRSLVIAVTAIVLNLLSVGAAYGAMVLVFQHHAFDGLLGFTATGRITDWIPLFMFTILFGLSMDYHVFIISRIRENHVRGVPTHEAIRGGISSTAGVITSAAVIMVAVFSVFGSLSQVTMKEVGVGLAVAVLLDATIVRGVLLPSVMALLSEHNWYLPRWLAWLPRSAAHGVAVVDMPDDEPNDEQRVPLPVA